MLHGFSFFLLDLVDCLHQCFNIQVGVDTFGERHGTGVSHNLLDHGLVYMGLCEHGDAGVPGTVWRLVISKLQKALDAAMKMISELKAKVASLTAELAEYKSVRGQLNTAGLEQQNELLRNKLQKYETVIERNNLWNLFRSNRKINHIRQENHSFQSD